MKYILVILVFFTPILSYCQSNVNRGSAANTVYDSRVGAIKNLYIPRYEDTIQANIAGSNLATNNLGSDSCGAQIYTYDIDGYWYRACFPVKHWERVTPSSANTAWDILGNNNVDSNTNFFGTTISQPVIIKINNNQTGKIGKNYNVSFGAFVDAVGGSSFATGSFTTANGVSSQAFGGGSVSNGNYSIAGGQSSVANGASSIAIGLATSASDIASVAMGNNTSAIGQNSFAMGQLSVATGFTSFAAGEGVYSDGAHSIAMGQSSYSLAQGSITMGEGLYANAFDQFVTGIFNDTVLANRMAFDPSDAIFTVGNGISPTIRSNAIEILKNGKVTLAGGYYFNNVAEDSILTIDYATKSLKMVAAGGSLPLNFLDSFYLNTDGDSLLVNSSLYGSYGVSIASLIACYPTLQEVTQNGKTTTDTIYLGGLAFLNPLTDYSDSSYKVPVVSDATGLVGYANISGGSQDLSSVLSNGNIADNSVFLISTASGGTVTGSGSNRVILGTADDGDIVANNDRVMIIARAGEGATIEASGNESLTISNATNNGSVVAAGQNAFTLASLDGGSVENSGVASIMAIDNLNSGSGSTNINIGTASLIVGDNLNNSSDFSTLLGTGLTNDGTAPRIKIGWGNEAAMFSNDSITFNKPFALRDGTQQSGYVLTSDADGNATWQAAGGGGGVTSVATDDATGITGGTITTTGTLSLANIPNSSLTNSTISGKALGTNLDALTAGFGLSAAGTYTGATARTFAVDTSVMATINDINDLSTVYLPIAGRTYTTTTGNGLALTTSTLTTGNLLSLSSTGTAAGSNTQTVLNIATSGANGTSTQSTWGLDIANTHTGTGSVNIGARFSASSGANNYALIVPATGGNVGIGTSQPVARLDVKGSNNVFAPIVIGASGTSVVTISDSVNAVSGVQMGNTNTGTAADFRFLIKDPSGHYFAFMQPSTGNTGTAIMGHSRSTADFIINAAGTSRDLVIGNADNANLIFGANNAEAMRIQGSLNVGIGTTPAASAKLDVSSTTQGFAAPRMTKAQRNAISSPVAGLLVIVTGEVGGEYMSYYNLNITTWQKVTAVAD